MKKLLTIVALALVLCLGVSAALAVTYEQLNATQKDAIAKEVTAAGILASSEELKANLKFTTNANGTVSWTYTGVDEDGNVVEVKDAVPSCGVDKHDTTVSYFYKIDNSKVPIASKAEAEKLACEYVVYCQQSQCKVCGATFDAVRFLPTTGHDYKLKGYTLTDASKLADGAELNDFILAPDASQSDLMNALCGGKYAGKKIYLASQCVNCGKWKVEKSLDAKADHTWASRQPGNSTETPEDILKWARAIQGPTCEIRGIVSDYCIVCGADARTTNGVQTWRTPVVPHIYTEKVYDINNLPNCKNGLTATYAYACKWCGIYEGEIRYFKDATTYTEKLTPEEAIKLGLAPDEFLQFYRMWYAQPYDRQAEIYFNEAYDHDGHFYVVLTDHSHDDYPCVHGGSLKLICVVCAKVKTVAKDDYQDMPIYTNVVSEKYIDCYTLKVEYQCAGCLGKVHENYKATLTLSPDDPRAHGGNWIPDASKYVKPTCTTNGSTTKYCALHPTVTKTEVLAATGHVYGPYTVMAKETGGQGEQRTTYEAKCLLCGEKTYAVIYNDQDPKDVASTRYYWKAGTPVPGNCRVLGYTEYTLMDSKTGKAVDGVPTQKVYTTYGAHMMEVVTEAHKAPTCTEPGQDLLICVTCTNYKPMTDAEKADKVKADKDWIWTIMDDMQNGKVFEIVEIPATGHKVDTWTENKDGKMEGICTVCKQTVTKDKELGAPAYKFADVKFDGEVLSGKLVHTAGTKDAQKLNIRVTFFSAGNFYVATTATIYSDLTFEAVGAGQIEAIQMVAYDSDSVLNPADVATLTKLDAYELIVK